MRMINMTINLLTTPFDTFLRLDILLLSVEVGFKLKILHPNRGRSTLFISQDFGGGYIELKINDKSYISII